jgi:hypothetical protein
MSAHDHDHDCVWISSCACFALLGTKAAAIVVQRAPCDWPPRQVTMPTAFGLGLALGVIDGGSRNLPLVSTPSTATCAGTCAGQSITQSVLPLPVDLTCPCLVHPTRPPRPACPAHALSGRVARQPRPPAPHLESSQPLFTIHPQPRPPCPYQRVHACAGSLPSCCFRSRCLHVPSKTILLLITRRAPTTAVVLPHVCAPFAALDRSPALLPTSVPAYQRTSVPAHPSQPNLNPKHLDAHPMT